ncbi:Regulatory protein BlaR1 [Botrimarina colliarenosi]|uniref:Regulatory protein BlaR1 n=1 Tax=Botrimarina colliarenosi TaxID=2528001 RepID=A0A5C6AFF6_9BACT|nr:M56 family metallopeptidase [Botrimarina colliarenosi]TWT98160.1 Regulatory protein BlaR1 [Botrimarina colliarenosi]
MTTPQWTQWLLSYALQASLVIGVAAALDRWTHAATAKSRLWTGCFVSLLGLLAVGLLAPHVQWASPWSAAPPNVVVSALEVEQTLGSVLLTVWAFGIAVMVSRGVIDFIRVQRFITRQPRVTSKQDLRIRSLIKPPSLLIDGRQVDLRVAPEELGPFCYQFHRPLVFVPESLLNGEADDDLRNVLIHEMTHLCTEHPMQVFLQKTTQCVLWFHPLVWMASGRAGIVREFVCDDAASDQGASTAAYLRTLLKVVENRQRRFGAGLTIGRSVSEVRLRAARLVANLSEPSGSGGRRAVAGVVVAAVVATLVWLPVDPLASPRSRMSPWPAWSASVLHGLGVPARDFSDFNGSTHVYELLHDAGEVRD